MQRFGFADEVEFVEDIPFTETRNYVKRVLGSYDRYKALYGTPRTDKREPRAATSARRTQ
jgi:soluble lytic murein transglycosylase-like protein